MNQNFSSQQLIKLCKKNELDYYGLTQTQLIEKLDETFIKILDNTFEFDITKVNNYFLADDLTHKLILRKLNDNIKRLYKDEQANRRIIISQIITLLNETCPKWILKTDINCFYESIDRNRLIEKLQNDSMLSYYSIQLLNKLFNNDLLIHSSGLPRGMNISATLSEIYMRKFDRWIRRFSGIYYYARFVDDIIIFGSSQESIDTVRNEINNQLEEGLIKKEEKTIQYDSNVLKKDSALEYLGYKFSLSTDGKKVIISIAKKKINKIKSRIIYAFLDYIRNGNYELLKKRIIFLTGNFSVRKNKYGNDLKAGIYYNYSSINDYSILDHLNLFYRKTLYSKNQSFGNKLAASLDTTQKAFLSKYSFKHGFTKKVYSSFSPDDINKIKECWLNE
jgi:hypothetical protein